MPRPSPNTRVKDLPDLALLASIGPLVAAELRHAIEATFSYRATHAIPRFLPAPDESWSRPYERMALQDELPWRTLAAVHVAASSFLDPLLAGVSGVWDQHGWEWR